MGLGDIFSGATGGGGGWGQVAGALGAGYLKGKGAKEAAQVGQDAQREAQQFLQQQYDLARQQAAVLTPVMENNLLMGYNAALDAQKQAIPEQINQRIGGNVHAQNLLKNAAPQFQSAILGGPVDYSVLQTYKPEVNVPQVHMPGFMSSADALREAGLMPQTPTDLAKAQDESLKSGLAAEGWEISSEGDGDFDVEGVGGVTDTTGQGRTSADFTGALGKAAQLAFNNKDNLYSNTFGIGTTFAGPVVGALMTAGLALYNAVFGEEEQGPGAEHGYAGGYDYSSDPNVGWGGAPGGGFSGYGAGSGMEGFDASDGIGGADTGSVGGSGDVGEGGGIGL